jgi:hypothetical protein
VRADQLLAVQEQHGPVGGAGQAQGGDGAGLAHLLDRDGLARLGQGEPAGVGGTGVEQGDDREGAVGEGLAGGEIAQGLGQRLDVGEGWHAVRASSWG